jgi:hypothetical protein
MGEVIKGPWLGNVDPDEQNMVLIQVLVEEMCEAMFIGLREAGFDNCEDMSYTKDLAMIAESLRSYMLRLQDRYHPVQDIADQLFDWDEDGVVLETQPSVHVDFLQ